MMSYMFDLLQVIIADLILSGDNSLIIGLAAAGLAPDLRRKAILYGMIVAAVLRIFFALIATWLLDIPGILFVGSLLLFWVCWRLFHDIRSSTADKPAHEQQLEQDAGKVSETTKRSLGAALISITVADFSMSLDNVLAVAAIADGDTFVLVFGLAFAILLMAFAATLIAKVLANYPWISWLGLVVLVYVASDMLYRGLFDPQYGISFLLG